MKLAQVQDWQNFLEDNPKKSEIERLICDLISTNK